MNVYIVANFSGFFQVKLKKFNTENYLMTCLFNKISNAIRFEKNTKLAAMRLSKKSKLIKVENILYCKP